MPDIAFGLWLTMALVLVSSSSIIRVTVINVEKIFAGSWSDLFKFNMDRKIVAIMAFFSYAALL